MKRGIWGIGILLGLLAFGIATSVGMRSIHRDIGRHLQLAQTAAAEEQWQTASAEVQQATSAWQRFHTFTAAFADHTPMDEMDGLFAELEVFLQNRESPHFEAVCGRLVLQAQAMADSHGIQWWNILCRISYLPRHNRHHSAVQ